MLFGPASVSTEGGRWKVNMDVMVKSLFLSLKMLAPGSMSGRGGYPSLGANLNLETLSNFGRSVP